LNAVFYWKELRKIEVRRVVISRIGWTNPDYRDETAF